MPNSRCRSRISSRICAWTVTSSAVVGSSAISTFGRHASAIAIITRWRMPPDSSCGYWSSRRAGSRDVHGVQHSIARRRASAPRRRSRVRRGSPRSAGADRQHRVERGHRLLEDHRDLAAAHARASRARQSAARSRSAEPDRAARRCAATARQQPHDRKRRQRLAGAGFAGEAQRLAGRQSRKQMPSTHAAAAPSGVARIRAHRSVDDRGRRRWRPCSTAGSLEDDAREVERHHPVRHVDDLADPQIAADRARACRRRPVAGRARPASRSIMRATASARAGHQVRADAGRHLVALARRDGASPGPAS